MKALDELKIIPNRPSATVDDYLELFLRASLELEAEIEKATKDLLQQRRITDEKFKELWDRINKMSAKKEDYVDTYMGSDC